MSVCVVSVCASMLCVCLSVSVCTSVLYMCVSVVQAHMELVAILLP